MSSKRFFVDKQDGNTGRTNQVGTGHRKGDDARAKVQDLRSTRERGSSDSFTVREGRKS